MILALVLAAYAADPFPPAPEPPAPPRRDEEPVPDDMPSFGSDVSAGYMVGALLGSWPTAGAHGAATVRYDAFAVDRHAGGPRLGASIWGAVSLWPVQTADESDPDETAAGASGDMVDIRYAQYGVMAIIRHDPSAAFSADAGLGFGRIDLNDYYGGVQALPTLTFEAGLRTRLQGQVYADWLVRGHWATTRSPTQANVLHEWWMVQGGVQVGVHLH